MGNGWLRAHMTFDQIAITCLLLGMLAAYMLERFRVEIVALTGLAAGYVAGLVPLGQVFSGFANPAVVTVAEVLLIVGGLSRTHMIDRIAGAIVARAAGERAALAVLCTIGALVSVSINNIGALALMMPVTLSVCARLGIAPARMLMPLSFATLLGGTCSLTGTPANLVVNQWLVRETGQGFGYFELGLVGGPATVAGLVWLVWAAGRRRAKSDAEPGDAGPAEFLAELVVPAASPMAGLALAQAEARSGLAIHDVVRAGAHVFARRDAIVLQPGDTLIVEGMPGTIERLAGERALDWPAIAHGEDRLHVVVMPDSTVVGSRVGWLSAFADHGVQVAALAARHRRIEGRFEDLQIGLGDVLILSGPSAALRPAAADAGVLALSVPRAEAMQPGAGKAVIAFALGIVATASGLAEPEIAFGAVVLAMAMLGLLPLRQGLQELNWPIVILLACMIPLGAAVDSTGAAHVIADALIGVMPGQSPFLIVAMMLVLSLAITPFVDNVSTAAVLSPIAAGVAQHAGVPLEPLLAAVAVGASLDFLTPFGHHNNAVVMGAGGYRFLDFSRLGAPLVVVSGLAALAALWVVWF